MDNPRLYEKPADSADLRARVLALQEPVLTLRIEQTEVKLEVRSWGKAVLSVLAVALVLLSGVIGVQMWVGRGIVEIKAGQTNDTPHVRAQLMEKAERKLNADLERAATIPDPELQRERSEAARSHYNSRVAAIDKLAVQFTEVLNMLNDIEKRPAEYIDVPRIKAQLFKSSERRLEADIAEANREPRWEERQRRRDSAQAAHQARLAQIDDLASSVFGLVTQVEPNPVYVEMIRTLQEEGVDSALTYIDSKRASLVEGIVRRNNSTREQVRNQLKPLLQATGLRAAKGDSAAARSRYHELLTLDPQWPQALEDYAQFLFDQSTQTLAHGTLSGALADAQQCLASAQQLYELNQNEPRAKHVLIQAHQQMSDVLTVRGGSGDSDLIFHHCQQSLALAEALHGGDPHYPGAARDLSFSLAKLGNFLARRGQPGDSDAAMRHYTRSNELLKKLLQTNPDSTQAARDVSLSLVQLGDFLAQRGRPGDAEAALDYYTRSLDRREGLLKASPDSAQAGRDVSVSLYHLGDFLVLRGRPGDREVAFQDYVRSFAISEELLKANPDSAQATRDVSVSLEKVGDFLAGPRAAWRHGRRFAGIQAQHGAAREAPESQSGLGASCERCGGIVPEISRAHGAHWQAGGSAVVAYL